MIKYPKSVYVDDIIDDIINVIEINKLFSYDNNVNTFFDNDDYKVELVYSLTDDKTCVDVITEIINHNTTNYYGYNISKELNTVNKFLDRQIKINKLI